MIIERILQYHRVNSMMIWERNPPLYCTLCMTVLSLAHVNSNCFDVEGDRNRIAVSLSLCVASVLPPSWVRDSRSFLWLETEKHYHG